ncbi:Lysosomal acid phosphatase [Trichinella sp. T9]|nr:Lysosomal acid phosphatase [Trichinella sp. T9]
MKQRTNVQLYRHGERTPLSTYPNDPYKEDAWPNGFKQLTVEGCRQQYELGNFLRRKYSKLLSKSYKSHEIYVRSTNTSRTLASAACNLAGLYRNFQPEPIPIHTVPEEEDFLLRTGLPCPGYDLAFKKDSRKVFSKIDEANEDFFKFVSKMSGIRDASTKSIGRLVGALEREIRNNFIMPDWIFAVWWDPTMGKYRTVYEMLYDINSHDGTVMSLMYALGIANDINPPVGSCIMFDLYKNSHTDRFYVEIQFKNDTQKPPISLILPKSVEGNLKMKATLFLILLFITVAIADLQMESAQEDKPLRRVVRYYHHHGHYGHYHHHGYHHYHRPYYHHHGFIGPHYHSYHRPFYRPYHRRYWG